ncbi:MAG: AraC family transcriptional regulator [Bacteroidia bacterium]|nr:AraC family transcriptional regulator [Bacteroidia bacterium]
MNPELEEVDLSHKENILAFTFSQKNFDAPWHFHPQHELTFIWESKGSKFIGDFVGPYETGELVLMRSNLPHCWKNQVDKNGMCKATVIQWNKKIFPEIQELNAILEMLRLASKGLLFDKGKVQSLAPVLEKMPKLKGHELYVGLLSLLSSLCNISYKTLSESGFQDDLPSEYSSRMNQIHDFVDKNYSRKVYLKEVAEVVNMSEQSFSRFFSKMMGRPFFTFLNEYRITVAGRLLIETDWSVSQIGYSCGYESLPFFHKQFSKFMNESPSRYRKKFA